MKRAESGAARARKERERVVRFLAAGPAAVRPAAKADTMLLEAGERGAVSARSETLAALAREGVIARQGALLALSPEGRALARRAESPAEPFRAQHMERETRRLSTATGETTVEANLCESPLAQLARRRTRNGAPFLAPDEVRAGERLRADYTRARIMPRLGANWDAAVASRRRGSGENGVAELTEAALSARQRVERALDAVGPELAGILVDVCCFLKGLEQVEAERGWPVRSAKVVLKTALGALSRHYEPPPIRRRAILHWGAEDYRPKLRT